MTYDGNEYIIHNILKKKLGLKGTFLWNIIYTTILCQIVFAFLIGIISFIVWYLFWNKWTFMAWRGTILIGIILGVYWIINDYRDEKNRMNMVVDNL